MTSGLGRSRLGIFAFDNVGWSAGECFGAEGGQIGFGAVASRVVDDCGEWNVVGGGGIGRWGNLNDWTGGCVCFVGCCGCIIVVIVVGNRGGSVDGSGCVCIGIDGRSTDGYYIVAVASGSYIGLSSLGLLNYEYIGFC